MGYSIIFHEGIIVNNFVTQIRKFPGRVFLGTILGREIYFLNNEKEVTIMVEKIWELYYRGYAAFEIANELDITEWEVIKVLNPLGY